MTKEEYLNNVPQQQGAEPGKSTIYPTVEAKGSQNIGSSVTFASLYYDIGQFGNFVPYIGASLGIAMHDAKDYVAQYKQVAK